MGNSNRPRSKAIVQREKSRRRGRGHLANQAKGLDALEILEGKVIGQCFPRHRHQEFLTFLRRLDKEFPEGLKLHLVLDNYGTHKHPKVQSWLKHHPRFALHFIPTSSSWLNQVER